MIGLPRSGWCGLSKTGLGRMAVRVSRVLGGYTGVTNNVFLAELLHGFTFTDGIKNRNLSAYMRWNSD